MDPTKPLDSELPDLAQRSSKFKGFPAGMLFRDLGRGTVYDKQPFSALLQHFFLVLRGRFGDLGSGAHMITEVSRFPAEAVWSFSSRTIQWENFLGGP